MQMQVSSTCYGRKDKKIFWRGLTYNIPDPDQLHVLQYVRREGRLSGLPSPQRSGGVQRQEIYLPALGPFTFNPLWLWGERTAIFGSNQIPRSHHANTFPNHLRRGGAFRLPENQIRDNARSLEQFHFARVGCNLMGQLQTGDGMPFLEDAGSEILRAKRISLRHQGEGGAN